MNTIINNPRKEPFFCSQCNQQFRRKDHLSRHLRCHTGGKSLRCTLCPANFSRRDALLRHSLVHGDRGMEVRQHLASEVTRTKQACRNCVESKKRCTDGIPCARCQKNGILCDNIHNSGRKDSPFQGDMINELQTNPRNTVHDFANMTTEAHKHPDVQHNLDTVIDADDSPWSTQSLCSNGMPTDLGNEIQGGTFPEFMAYNPQFDLGLHHLQWIHGGADLEMRNMLPDGIVSQELRLDDHIVNSLAGSLNVFDTSEADSRLPTSRQAFLGSDTVPGTIQAVIDPNYKASEEVLKRENFYHVTSISKSAYGKFEQFFVLHQTAVFPECPSLDMMHAFTELYFEFFDHNFPCIHKRQLQDGATSWILLAAVASIGSQYSAIENAISYTKYLQLLLEKAIHQYTPVRCSDITIDFAQSVFISQINLCCDGKKSAHLKQEYQRSLLFTLVKQLDDDPVSRRKRQHSTHLSIDEKWKFWLNAETLARLKYCIIRFECLQLALFNLKPQHFDRDCTRHEISIETLWNAETAQEWNLHRSLVVHSSLQSPFEEIVLTGASITEERLENLEAAYQTALRTRLQERYSELLRTSHSTLTGRDGLEAAKRLPYRSILIDRLLEHILEKSSGSGYLLGFGSDCSLHIMSILRHVSLTAIYAFSGWEADFRERQEARTYLENWILNDMASVRRCLWHAACVFRDLRNTSHFSCFDSFFILIATLVLWAYCILASKITCHTDEASCTHREPVRIDSFKDYEALQHWLQHCSRRKIHLAGLGILEGPEGAKRVIEEYRNILRSRKGWSNLRDELAYLAEQLLADRLPRRRDSKE